MEFPADPQVNDTYTYGGRTWIWTGYAWENADTVAAPAAPSAPTSAGVPGQLSYENGFLYVCVSPGSWGRLSLGSWYPGEGIDGTILDEAGDVLTTETDDPFLF